LVCPIVHGVDELTVFLIVFMMLCLFRWMALKGMRKGGNESTTSNWMPT
jgi:hypothetical protein